MLTENTENFLFWTQKLNPTFKQCCAFTILPSEVLKFAFNQSSEFKKYTCIVERLWIIKLYLWPLNESKILRYSSPARFLMTPYPTISLFSVCYTLCGVLLFHFTRNGKATAHKMTAKPSAKILFILHFRVSNNLNKLNAKTACLWHFGCLSASYWKPWLYLEW